VAEHDALSSVARGAAGQQAVVENGKRRDERVKQVTGLRMPAEQPLVADLDTSLGVIAPKAPEYRINHLVAVGPAVVLDQLHDAFVEAVLTLDTASRFGQSGIVRLADLGPRPLVVSAAGIAAGLSDRHLRAFDGPGRANHDIEETTRVYLECNQQVREVSQRLAVHPNTVRYRVHRFHELTGLDLRRTEDLVTAWWLLNRRRPTARLSPR
jgi:sugar diacid utilization regulator